MNRSPVYIHSRKSYIYLLIKSLLHMITTLHRLAQWKLVLPLALAFACFTGYLFPNYQAQLSALAGEEVQLLDLYPSYSTAEVQQLFSSIQSEGIAIHQRVTSVWDMIYPLIYTSFTMLLLSLLLKRVCPPNSLLQYLAFFPLIVMGFDYAENFNTLQLLDSFPNLDDALVAKGSQLTNYKHRATGFLLGFIVLSAIGYGAKWARERVKQ